MYFEYLTNVANIIEGSTHQHFQLLSKISSSMGLINFSIHLISFLRFRTQAS